MVRPNRKHGASGHRLRKRGMQRKSIPARDLTISGRPRHGRCEPNALKISVPANKQKTGDLLFARMKYARELGSLRRTVLTKVAICWGSHEERFGQSLQDRLDHYSKPVKWMSEEVAGQEPELFGDSQEAKAMRESHPWLKKTIFAHVTNMQDITKQGSPAHAQAGKVLIEAMEFQFVANHIHMQKGEAGDEKILYPLSKKVNVKVRLERSQDGFIFGFISGAGSSLEPARIQLSRMLTGLKTHQLRHYYLAPAEVDALTNTDKKGNKIGDQYHWKVDEGGSVVFRDTKDSQKMWLSGWLAKLKKRKPMRLQYQSKFLNGEWVELDGRAASVSWTRTDPERLVDYARKFVVPELIKSRGGAVPWKQSPYI